MFPMVIIISNYFRTKLLPGLVQNNHIALHVTYLSFISLFIYILIIISSSYQIKLLDQQIVESIYIFSVTYFLHYILIHIY